MPVSRAEQRAAAALRLPGLCPAGMLSFSQSHEHSPAARCLQEWKKANKAIQGTNEDKSRHFYLLTNSLPAEELKCNPLEKLEHPGTAEAAVQQWGWRGWGAEKVSGGSEGWKVG